ncbi:hypothetical protein [Marisediminicola sp. LYQ85]|uniref:hypothetical protein n=1 Tax=Marisediminicola sp. LYQ85 TaxID=3391062 RepID=UPI00398371C4
MTSLIGAFRRRSLVAVTGVRHGLGNRVRVVLGCRSLARAEGRAFFYTWTTGADFGATMDELWSFNERTMSRSAARALAVRFPYRDNTLEWLDDAARADRVLQIKTPHALVLPAGAVPWDHDLRALRPVGAIVDRVRAIHKSSLAPQPYVGVMIRSHQNSHAATRETSPVEWYVRRMKEIREVEPDMRFFVSADTEEARAFVSEQVPGTVSQSDKGAFNSAAGLRSAVADLYLLASSTRLLGPHFSSFPELAQKLAGDGMVLETPMSTPEPFDRTTALTVVEDPSRPSVRLSP